MLRNNCVIQLLPEIPLDPYNLLWSESIDVYTAISSIKIFWCVYFGQDTTTTLTRTPIYWSLVYLGFYLNLKNWSILCVNLQIFFNQPPHACRLFLGQTWIYWSQRCVQSLFGVQERRNFQFLNSIGCIGYESSVISNPYNENWRLMII